MPKLRRRAGATSNVRVTDPPRHAAPLPAERVAAQPFVYFDGRIIAPWPTHAAMTPDDERRLLAVLDYVRVAKPDAACWLWPERGAPEPIKTDGDLRHWLVRWSEGRTSYAAR
jgi:hypothetical protein